MNIPLPSTIGLIGGLISDVINELIQYTNRFNEMHWGIVAGCCVAFGFLCLKGGNLNR
ncbi:hypothetical protein [Roseiconus nitratireducens]|uniref:hypothetical protein n=1 Tax=Roseiconus nitratireducens TaxID=2605748 RepID=UPI0013763DCB|nr:hypothetical protein [Roseiconus nitratireducens]